ncbi:uncharacterized protein LOC133791738 [Humulus lupulus]|uniref:uncharacterized protein LOC133791738 n=1 Tax=Humulus lupulus TaxID=3486 RepID=UPI002B417413|nr:uncharacterized protein LOC133791738 [Humulus lupulus]
MIEWCSRFWANFKSINSKSFSDVKCKTEIKWHPPDTNCLKVNVDAGLSKEKGRWGCAAVARDSFGQFRGFRSLLLDRPVEPFVAELIAIRVGMNLGLELGPASFSVESDSLNAVQAISSPTEGYRDWDGLTQSLLALMASPRFLGCSFVRREANNLAHFLAKLTLEMGDSVEGNMALPLAARSVLQRDLPFHP